MTPQTTLWLDILADVSTIIAALAVLITTFFVARQVGLQARDVGKCSMLYPKQALSAYSAHLIYGGHYDHDGSRH